MLSSFVVFVELIGAFWLILMSVGQLEELLVGSASFRQRIYGSEQMPPSPVGLLFSHGMVNGVSEQ